MINSLEIGKSILEIMFISEMALLWETFFSRELPSIGGFSGPVSSLLIRLLCLFVIHEKAALICDCGGAVAQPCKGPLCVWASAREWS